MRRQGYHGYRGYRRRRVYIGPVEIFAGLVAVAVVGPMLENPELLKKMVHDTGAHSTDLESPETVEHLCDKCASYAACWKPEAERLWRGGRSA